MSEIWLVLAVGCVFFTVLLVGFALDASSTERKRAVRLLENQVTGSHSVASANLREQELSQSFGQRVLVPFVGGAGKVARRITPLDSRDRVAKKLMLAGSPAGWDAERIIAFKVIGAGAGFLGALVFAKLMHLSGVPFLASVGLLTVAGFLVPDSLVARKVAVSSSAMW